MSVKPDIGDTIDVAATFNAARGRYELAVDGGIAFADVREIEDRVIFVHTEVPFALRGNGIGGRLIRSALEDVRRRGRKVVPRCWFVSEFIQRNPEFRDLLAS